MLIPIIIVTINIIIAWSMFYMGKQNVTSDLLKAYKEECERNKELQAIIATLKNQLASTCKGKEAAI